MNRELLSRCQSQMGMQRIEGTSSMRRVRQRVPMLMWCALIH